MYTVAMIPSTKGYHWEEVFAAYKLYKEAGWKVLFYTVDGTPPVVDPKSIELHPILSYLGLGVDRSFAPESKLGVELKNKLENEVIPVSQLIIDPIDALYIPGGHGCLFDVNVNEVVHQKILQAFNKSKMISAVCHGTSCLAFVKNKGDSIIKGKKVIGFPDALDAMLKSAKLIDEKFLPLPYKNEQTLKEAGANITVVNEVLGLVNPSYTVVDLPFITGIGPKAAARVANKVINIVQKEL